MESAIRRKEAPGLSAKNMLRHGGDYTTFEGIESPKLAKTHTPDCTGCAGVDGEKGSGEFLKTRKRRFDWEGC